MASSRAPTWHAKVRAAQTPFEILKLKLALWAVLPAPRPCQALGILPSMTFFERHKVRRVVNALGTSTIVGANVAPSEVIAATAEALGVNCEIDELQRAACCAIAKATGAEAGCVTSSAASGIAVA